MLKYPLIIDLDGVLRIGNRLADNVHHFFNFLEESKINSCILSNSSLYCGNSIKEFFHLHSVKLSIPIITTVDATLKYSIDRFTKVAVYTSEEVRSLFSEILDYNTPQAVVIGDIDDKWNFEIMQNIFNYVRNGAELIAMHKNKYWNKPDKGIQLDAGTFIHGIEYAASVTATLIGKPSKFYFQSALKTLGYNSDDNFIMLGDDVESDIVGAKSLNAFTILIYTGKTQKPVVNEYRKFVNFEADNLVEVIKIIKNNFL